MTTFAGRPVFPSFFVDASGKPQPNLTVTIYNRGTVVKATLYTDRTKATVAVNPTATDSLGNLWVFLDPGDYDLVIGAEAPIPFSVLPEAADVGALNTYRLFTANEAWVVPPGITTARVRAIGGGGGGGGGGSALAVGGTATQVGGAGGASGTMVDQQLTVVPGESLDVVVGVGGAGGAGGALNGQAGVAGTAGAASTLKRAAALLVSATGGNSGDRGLGNSTASVIGGAYGTTFRSLAAASPGSGGLASSGNSHPGAAGFGLGAAGGGGGGPANATNGGNAGTPQAIAGSLSSAGAAGGSATANGANGAAATIKGSGGVGGGGGAPGGAGGAGGAGAAGQLEIWW